jgi:hypothetical protein
MTQRTTTSEETKGRWKTVRIINTGGKNIVWPPCVVLTPGDDLEIYAVNTDATVTVPMPAWFDNLDADFETNTEKGVSFRLNKGKSKKFKVRKKADLEKLPGGKALAKKHGLPKTFPYAVYCDEGNDFAVGFSSPVMLIEPPNGRPGGGG